MVSVGLHACEWDFGNKNATVMKAKVPPNLRLAGPPMRLYPAGSRSGADLSCTQPQVAHPDQVVGRESLLSRLVRLVAFVLAVALLWLPKVPIPFFQKRFLPPSVLCFWGGAGVTAVGLLFAIWARHHLGSNWSQAVTVKEGHELIQSGPYALVRHPIYTGLLLGFAGCAVARGELRGVVAVALVFSVLWLKLRLEEKWMNVQFGDSYKAYSQRVAAWCHGSSDRAQRLIRLLLNPVRWTRRVRRPTRKRIATKAGATITKQRPNRQTKS